MSDIDEVKSRLNIVDIVSARVALKKAGRHFKALCPFHSEKTPSFIVSPERQTWHCFGCGKGGSVIDFVMEYEHVDFIEALESLAEKAGVKLERRPVDTAESKLKQKLYEVNHLASEFYHFLLTKHSLGEKARSYLKNRGVSDKSLKTFMLGYSPNSWDGLLKFLIKKGYDEKILETASLVIASTRSPIHPSPRHYDRFRGRVMFTLKDHRGNVVGFSGRLLDPDIKEAKYINTSETPVYSKSNVLYGFDVTREVIAKENQAILMEGEFDVISSFQAGIGNAVAIKGSALTEGHVNLLRRFTDRLVFALDSDLAGDAAARRGIELADASGLDIRVVSMPSGKDPDEAARGNPGLLRKAIKEAEPIYDYFLRSVSSRFDLSTAYGKKKASEELLPTVAAIENPIVQSHYVKVYADTLGVTEDAVRDGMKKVDRLKTLTKTASSEAKQSLTRIEKLELYVLALLLQGKPEDLLEDFFETIKLTQISTPSVCQILERLSDHLKSHRIFLIRDFADSLPKELVSTLDTAFLWDISDIVDDDVRFAKEWGKTLTALSAEIVRQEMVKLTKQIKEATDEKVVEELKQKLQAAAAELKELEKASEI